MQQFITEANLAEVSKCESYHATNKMLNAIKAFIGAKDYNWLTDDSHDIAVARILAVFVFNNEVTEDAAAREDSLKNLKDKGWANTEFAKEWRDNMITLKQAREAVKKYLCDDPIVDTIFDAVQCNFEKGYDRSGVRGRYNQWSNHQNLYMVDHEISCIMNGLNNAYENKLKDFDPWSQNIRGGGAAREYVLRRSFNRLREYIKRFKDIKENDSAEWEKMMQLLQEKWETE